MDQVSQRASNAGYLSDVAHRTRSMALGALWNVSGAHRTLAMHLSNVPSDCRVRTRALGGNGYNEMASTRVNGRYIGHSDVNNTLV